MRNLIIGAAAAALLATATAAPALAADDGAAKNASKACKAQRTAIGAAAFAELHGTNHNKRNALGKCVSKMQKLEPAQQQVAVEAAKSCKDERTAMGAEAFAAKYGTNHNKRNALGKCVSAKTEAAGAPA